MTKEIAIHNLYALKLRSKSLSDRDALDMAIKALEQQPCEDAISRQAVKEMLTEEWTKYMPMELDINLSFILDKISALPSVTPTRPHGEWIYVQYDGNKNIGNWHCSNCRQICIAMHSMDDAFDFCPNCGADMREVQDD